MAVIKGIMNPIIDQSTNVALKLIDTITKAGFIDYSVPKSINKCLHIPKTKLELLDSINSDPTNVELYKKLEEMYKENFEMRAYNLHKEIREMLLK